MSIDRISPTRRPQRIAAGYQQWRSLLFMHWSVPVDKLRSLVPPELEIDLYDSSAYVGLVPFAMQGVRPRWCPPRLGFNFLETNVRTYVVHNGRPGVYFFSLDAASRIGVWIARKFWGLPYFFADMRLERRGDSIHYQSTRLGSETRLDVQSQLGERLGPAEPDSIEFFFLERYLLFLERRGVIYSGQVHHSAYPAQKAKVSSISDGLLPAAGFSSVHGPPEFVHFSPGVDVEIFGLQAAKDSL